MAPAISLASSATYLNLLIPHSLGKQGQGQVCLDEPWDWCIFQNLNT